MRIEHIAYNVKEPKEVAAWFQKHLGFSVKRKLEESPFTHFLADSSDRVMVEIYSNPKAPIPDYWGMDPLVLHLALAVDDVFTERERLLAAGAHSVSQPEKTPYGDDVAMLRDPWGFPVQLVRRAEMMVE